MEKFSFIPKKIKIQAFVWIFGALLIGIPLALLTEGNPFVILALSLLAFVGFIYGFFLLGKRKFPEGSMPDPRSGISSQSEPIPELKKWNWGAFILTVPWSITHRNWLLGILSGIPLIGLFIQIYLGIKGNQIAWKKNQWMSPQDLLQAQKVWNILGIISFVLSTLIASSLLAFLVLSDFDSKDPRKTTSEEHEVLEENILEEEPISDEVEEQASEVIQEKPRVRSQKEEPDQASVGSPEQFDFIDESILPHFSIPKNWYYSSEYSARVYSLLFDTEDIAPLADGGFWPVPVVMRISEIGGEDLLQIDDFWVEGKDEFTDQQEYENGTLNTRKGFLSLGFGKEFSTEYYKFQSHKNGILIELARFNREEGVPDHEWEEYKNTLSFEYIDL